jgi:hypothetical protein
MTPALRLLPAAGVRVELQHNAVQVTARGANAYTTNSA